MGLRWDIIVKNLMQGMCIIRR